MSAILIRHPAHEGPQIELSVLYEQRGDRLWVCFAVHGELNAVLWPMSGATGRADRLWERTCFEVFVATPEGYREFNLSPSGQWASYRFSDYRADMTASAEGVHDLTLDSTEDRMTLMAELDLPPNADRIGLSAVIQDREGARSFWALTHPGEAPDFHHPASFTLDLTEPA